MSPDKTLIMHARTERARFLGSDLLAQHSDTKITRRRRMTNGVIGLRVPKDVIDAKCALYCKGGQPASRHPMVRDEDFTIMAKFGADVRAHTNVEVHHVRHLADLTNQDEARNRPG
jgi:hypothetical protein